MILKCLDSHVAAAYEVGNDQETVQSERNSHSKQRDGKNLIVNQALIINKNIQLAECAAISPKGVH